MIPMNLALLLPDWNSLDSVRSAHSSLELWSIWLFAVLVVCDVVAHLIEDGHKETAKIFEKIGLFCFLMAVLAELGAYKYGQRSDKLSGDQIISLDALAKKSKVTADEAKTTAGEAQTEADAAIKSAAIAEGKISAVGIQANKIGNTLDMSIALINARRVEDADKLSEELKKQFKGRKVQLVSYAGDVEAWGLCTQLVNVVKNAEMVPEEICGKAWFTSPLISPLSITAANWDEEQSIAKALIRHGHLGSTGALGPNMVIFVGVKSPFIIGETDQTRDAERRAAKLKHPTSNK